MRKIKLKLAFKDADYSSALSKAILLRYKGIELTDGEADFILDESLALPYKAVQEIINQTMAKLNRPLAPPKPLKDIIFTVFTSGVGGGGLTTTALCYAKIKSEIFKSKIAFVSFDPPFRQSFEKEVSLQIFRNIPKELSADELVIDLPYGIEGFFDILDMSERRIVVCGYNENRSFISDNLFTDLLNSSSNYSNPPKTYRFENHFEINPDSSDIHSQLGKEMLEFARKLERDQA